MPRVRVWIIVKGSVMIVFRVRVSLTIRFRGLLRNDVHMNLATVPVKIPSHPYYFSIYNIFFV